MKPFDPVAPPLGGARMMRQTWSDITFVHWAVDPADVAPLLPRGTRPDVLDGATFVGLIPFRMERAGFGRGPAVPWLGSFAETNVRLYSVDDEGRHGVVFASLEASRLLVSVAARLAFALPYTWARMGVEQEGDVLTYTTSRRWPRPHGVGGRLSVRVGDELARPAPVDEFVTARFGLHTRALGRTWWIPNHHDAWPLRSASLLDLDDSLVAAAGLPGVVATTPASVVHSRGTRTTFGLPRPVGR